MARNLPTTEEEMLSIDGVTEVNFRKFGKRMLQITTEYAEKKKGKESCWYKFAWTENYTMAR